MATVTVVAKQLPPVREPASKAGRGLYRKQVLPVGTVEHPTKGNLEFSKDILEEIVATFDGGAMDQVSFCLVNDENKHSDDPERHRGEVRSLELADDGLYAVIDPSDRGAQVLADNPRLPVSARITVPETGPFAGRVVLAHVAGTPDPVAKGMKGWERIDASKDTELIDLSEGCFRNSAVAKDGTNTEGKEALNLSDEEKGVFAKLFERFTKDGEPKPEAKATETPKVEPAKPEVKSDEDEAIEKWLSEFPGDGTVEVKTEEKELAGAALSKEDREKIDMAESRADKADLRAGKTDLSARLDALVRDGVPPAQVQAAREKLIGESDEQKRTLIDFANDRKPPAVEAALATLEAAKGTVNFSEDGTSTVVDEDDEKVKAARKIAEQAAERYV